jgi:hypothetical protein
LRKSLSLASSSTHGRRPVSAADDSWLEMAFEDRISGTGDPFYLDEDIDIIDFDPEEE